MSGNATVTVVAQDSGGTANGGVDKTTNTFTITVALVNHAPSFVLPGSGGGGANGYTLSAWGRNSGGQLGDPSVAGPQLTPLQIGASGEWRQVKAGWSHTLGIKQDGTLWAWGVNSSLQLGTGSTAVFEPTPTQVGTANDWVFVAPGQSTSYAIKSDGTLWGWGNNSDSAPLGAGTTDNPQATPVQIGADTDWVAVAALNGGLGLKRNGTLWGWGANSVGQLGLGNLDPQATPVQIGTDTDWASMVTDITASIAIKTTGTLWSWGSSSFGQLGLGAATTQTLVPMQVGTDTNWRSVAMGRRHAVATKTDGTLWGWGYNVNGQLGNGTTAGDGSGTTGGQYTPLQSGTDTNWRTVAAAKLGDSSMAIKSDGTLWGWGQNASGMLGIGNASQQLSPVQVGTATDFVSISCGNVFSIALNGSVGTGLYSLTVAEDSGAQSVANFATSISPGPANEAAQVVSFTVTNNNNALFTSQPAISAAGTLTFTLAANANGVATVTVIAQDDGGTANGGVDTSAPQTFTITVTPVNDSPGITFATNNLVVLEDSGAATVSSFATFSPGAGNESGQSITNVTTSNSNPGLFSVAPSVNTAGVLTFKPAANANGSATVTVIAQDDGGTANGGVDKATNTFTLTVTAVNDAPTITFANATVSVPQDSGAASVSSFATFSTGPANESGQTITNVTVTSDNPSLFSAGPAFTGGTLTFTPAAGAAGSATVTVVAQDDGGTANGGVDLTTNTFTITITIVNHAPTFTLRPVNTQSLVSNGSFETGSFTGWVTSDTANTSPSLAVRADGSNLGFFNVSSSDGTYSASHGFSGAQAGSISIAQDVVIPPNGVATLSFTYRAAWQNFGAAGNRVFRVAVQPSGGGADLYSQTLVTATPNTIGFATTNTPVTMDLSAYSGRSVRLVFVTDIAAGDVGNGSFQLDNVVLSATTPDFVVYENSSANSTVNFATNIVAGPATEASQTVTFTVNNNNNGLFSSQPAIDASGLLTFTTAHDSNGVATVTVIARDNGGTANGGVDTSVAKTFTVTVLPVNSSPRITPTSVTVLEDSGAFSATRVVFAGGPSDELSQSITNVVTSNDNNTLFSAQPAVSTAGVLTFTPALNANGSATVTVVAQDNGGTANGGVNLATNTFTITVTPVNDAPSFALPQGPVGPAGVVWTARDSTRNWLYMASSADGTKLAVTVDPGQIYTSSDSGVTWTGRDSVRSWAEVAMSADGTKLAATVTGGQIYTSTDSGVTWTARENNRNWRHITSSTNGTKLAAVVNGGQLFTSADSGVTWTARDSNRGWTGIASSDDGTKLVATVESGNIYRSTDSGVTWTALTGAGTKNWRRICSSADGTKLAVGTYGDYLYTSSDSGATWIARTAQGSGTWYDIACSSDGTKLVTGNIGGKIYISTDSGVTWTPQDSNRSWLGMASSADGSKLAAVVQGGQLYTSVGVPGPAVVTVLEDSGAYSGGAGFVTSISPGPADESAQTVSFTVTNNLNSLFSVQPAIDASGTLTFTPAANSNGTATVTVIARDNGGTANGGVDTSAAQTFIITVTAVNDAPTVALSSANVTVLEDSGANTVNGFATVTSFGTGDTGQAILGYTLTADKPSLFSVQPAINTSGVLTFTPAANSNGVATITVVAQDNGGTANGGVDKTTNTFTITITAVNDAPSFALNGGVLNSGSGGGGGSGDGLIVGGATYYPAGGATVLVAPDLTYSNSVSSTTAGAAVSIDNGQSGDVLGWSNSLATSYGISGSYNSTTKVLSFTGSATTAQYQEVLRSVNYSNASGTPTTDRSISFNVGLNTLYNPLNGHFYEYISSGLSWQAAFAAATNRTFQGMRGYLATVTSQAENDFIQTKLQADAWIGASDDFNYINAAVGSTLYANQSASEGKWYWVSGPEAGTQFMTSNGSPISGKYSNWRGGEPNNAGNENYAEFYVSGGWNDLNGSQGLPYVVEYGGQAGDVTSSLALSGSRILTYNPVLQVVEDSGAHTYSLALTNILAGPPDESGQTVNFIVSNTNNTLFTSQPVIDASGTLSFTLAGSVYGTTTVTVQAHDNGGTANGGVDTSAAKTFTIVVLNVNHAPTVALASNNVTVLEDSGLKTVSGFATVASFGTNESTQTLLGHVVTAANSSLFSVQPAINTSGVLTFTPAANANGSTTVTVVSQDSGGTANGGVDKTTNTFTIAITPVNDAPSFALPGGPNVPVGAAWTARESSRNWYAVASSADGTKLAAVVYDGQIYTSTDSGVTWTARDSSRSWAAIASSADGTKLVAAVRFGQIYTSADSGVTWVAQASGNRFWWSIVSSADGKKLAATERGGPIYTSTDFGVTWTAQASGNQYWGALASSADGTKLVAGGTPSNIYTSTDSGVTWQVRSGSPSHDWVSIASSADGTKLAAWGDSQFYTSTDSGVTWTLQSGIPTQNSVNLRSVASSADGTKLAATSGQILTSADSGVTWTAQPSGSLGWISIASSADGMKLVAAVYPAGQIYTSAGSAGVTSVTVLENSGAFTTNTFATNILAGPADEQATQTVTFTVTADNTALFSTQPVISTAGTLTFTPATDAFGTATVTVIAQDDGGTANGGVDTSAAQTFTIAVTPVNDAPTVALASATVTVLEDSGLKTVSGFASVTSFGPGESSQTLLGHTVTAATPSLFSVQPAISTSGVLTFTPAANANGSTTVTVVSQDSGGTANGGVDKTTNTFTITITPVNDAPSFALPSGGGVAGTVTTFAGTAGVVGSDDGTGPAAQFGSVYGVAVDAAGNVYVPDSQYHTLRKITPAGVVTTLAGSPGLPGTSDGTGSAARFYAPTGAAVDSAGNIYITDQFYSIIRKVTPAGVVTTLAGSATYGSADGTGAAASFYGPHGIAVDPAGNNIYVADTVNRTIRKVTAAGVVTTLAGQAGNQGTSDGVGAAAQFDAPTLLALDSHGDLYVSDRGVLRKVSTSDGTVTTIAPAPALAGLALGVAVDSSDNVFVIIENRHVIQKVSPAGVVTTIAGVVLSSGSADGVGSAARFNYPYDLALDNAGNLFVADTANNTIRKVVTGSGSGSATVAVLEDSGAYVGGANFVTSISPGPANEASQVVSFTVTSDNTALFSSQPAISAAGTLTFTPATNASGTATVTVIAQDDGGTANGGVDTSAAQTFTITVTAVNDAPTITFSTNLVTVLEDSGAYSGALATFTTGPANESSQSITNLVVSNDNTALFSGQPAVSAGGVLTFTPATNANGSATVTVIAQDNGGTANGGVDKATNTFTITVTAVNDAPSFALPAGAAAGRALKTWGNNGNGQLGDGTYATRITPVTVGTATNWQSISAGAQHTLAVKGDGTLWAWGLDGDGELGDGTTDSKPNPVQVGTAADWQSVSAGSYHSVAVKSNGTLWAWGYNNLGQLGDGTTVEKTSPVQIGSATDWQSVAGGDYFTVAVKTDGTLWAWGANGRGQLGDGTTDSQSSPVQIGTDANWQLVAASYSRTMAVKRDGTLWGWGVNGHGQLGDGTTADKLSPVQIGTAANWQTVAAGAYHTLAVKQDGTLWAWGQNDYGQLGDGSNDDKTSPVQIGTATDWQTVAGGYLHSLGVKRNGTLWAWGANGSGRLGDGSLADQNSPIQVGTATDWLLVAAGAYHSAAITGGGAGSYALTVQENSGAYTGGANFATSISAGPANESSQTVNFLVSNDNNALFSSQPAIAANGTLTFTPAGSGYGSATVTVIAQDDGGTANGGVDTSAAQTFTITVSPLATRVFLSGATPAGRQGETLVVPILLKAAGTENAVGFTLNFDASKLTYAGAALGADATGASLLENTGPAANGRVGFVLTRGTGGGAFTAGTNELLLVSFTVSPTATVGTTPVTFTDATARREVTDASATVIATAFVDGSVTIASAVAGTASNYEGDVAPRPYGTGNGSVTVADAVLIGRFAAGLDTANSANGEFQRADCAPLGTKGDGRITVADWVQSLRFAAGLDTPGTVGGPTVQATGLGTHSAKVAAGGRVVRVVSSSLIAGQANTVTVQIDAQGNESGVSLSLSFDPTTLTFVSATTASGATGGSLMVNSVKAAAGKVGLVLVMPAGQSLAAGTKDLVTLTFNVTGTGSTAISVSGDSPVAREVADVTANVLGASFVDGTFNILLPAGLKAAGIERAVDGSLRLVVRNADGTAVTDVQAAKYQVYVTGNLGGAWTLLANALVVENGALKIVDPASKSAGVRLYKLVVTP